MKHKLFSRLIITLFLITPFLLQAQIYSFEDGLVPASWTVSSGTLKISTAKYKLGTKSLEWSWNAGSKMTATLPDGLTGVSKNNSGGIYCWIYNTKPSTSKLIFSFTTKEGLDKCHIDFSLNFKGWRCMTAGFAVDMGHDKSELTKMIVQVPDKGNGQIYIDYVEFTSSIKWDRMSDYQYSVHQGPVTDFLGFRSNGNFRTIPKASKIEIEGSNIITKRLEDWYLSSGKYTSAPEFFARKSAISKQISVALSRNTDDLNLKTEKDGTINGTGLYPDNAPAKINGEPLRKFKDVMTGCMLPLAYDYRMNNVTQSKEKWLNLIDWFNDQGWADGSAMGGLMGEKLRSSGYFNSLFLMRNELDSARLNRELNTLNWFGLWGNVNVPAFKVGENADQIRTMSIAKLDYALMQPDPNKRVAALTAVTNYFNKAFSAAPGYSETFKPDFSGYHHSGPYFSAYYSEALYSAAWVCYLLHDTPYALSDSIYNVLKNCLLTFRNVASVYDVPVGVSGRFPVGTKILDSVLPAFAYLALSKNEPDKELLAAFSRLWKPTISPLKDNLSKAGIGITLQTTLGETELCLQAASLKVPAENSPVTAFYLPYSGLMINRNAARFVSLKGFSKYIWDYESDNGGNNIYGRYVSYGQLEYTDLRTNRRNNDYKSAEWDWNRIPGTTTKYLPKEKLVYGKNTNYRNYSDSPFLGGMALNDSVSMFSMLLHDTNFDRTFTANKSVFCFGNVLVCLGSGINNKDNSTRTETTLFQQAVNAGENITVNGKSLTENQTGLQKPVIRDNLGNLFIVKSGLVDINKSETMCSAVINHGTTPQNQKYCYFMLLQSNESQEIKYSNITTCPVLILRQDSGAHIVKQMEQSIWGYAIFNAGVALNDKWIKQVNTPSLAMFQKINESTFQLMVSDPDMHRLSGPGTNKISKEAEESVNTPFNYEITLNGKYRLSAENKQIKLTNTENTTKISITVLDGKSYFVKLVKI
jgi:chondroitin-sulfate-ABC endolyase/exolyase